MPFMGEAGLLLRRELLARVAPDAAATPEALATVGERFFWLNIVPYKPLGNDVWPASLRHRFRPLMLECLLARWQGSNVITMGQHAFEWFGIGQPLQVRRQFHVRWKTVLRSHAEPVPVVLCHGELQREFRVWPLPHPSPRNVLGRRAFPALLHEALQHMLP